MEKIIKKASKQLILCLLVMMASFVWAHATIVLGTLQTDPFIPQPGEPFNLILDMADPAQVPVEDAVVIAEFRLNGEDPAVSLELKETNFGQYTGQLSLPEAGDYVLLLRDQTFRQEEARASLELSFGNGPMFPEGKNAFVFPPTATSNSLMTWLIWLIAIPIIAGIIVTVLVLINSRGEKDGAAKGAK